MSTFEKEDRSPRDTAGTPHNQPNQPSSGDKTEPTLPQKCAKAIGKINRIDQYRTPAGLRTLRKDVNKLIVEVNAAIRDLKSEADSGDDLDKFDCEDQIAVLEAKLAVLEKGPAKILTQSGRLRQRQQAEVGSETKPS